MKRRFARSSVRSPQKNRSARRRKMDNADDQIEAYAEFQANQRSNHNDEVNEAKVALRFAEIYAGRLRYCHDTGKWFKFDGIWRQDRVKLAFRWAAELVQELSENEEEKTKFTLGKAS